MQTKEMVMDNPEIKEGERLDDLQLSNLSILQDPERFCFGMDAVLLSGFIKNRQTPGKRVNKILDLCTGTGIIPLLLSAKIDAEKICGIEIQPDSADMARRSVSINQLENRINIVTGDILEAVSYFEAASFDIVTCNPPYMTGGHGVKNPDSALAIARHELCCTLDDVCRIAAKMVKVGGSFYMVHRPFRLAEIIRTLSKYNLEPKCMRFIHPYADKEPNMILIQAVRGGKPRMDILPPLIVYESAGVYSEEMRNEYGY